jgi:predicted small metal-binding protein
MTMAYKLTCADTGAKCPFTVTTESREELVDHVKIHARVAHPDMAPPAPDVVDKLIKTV